MLIVIACHCTLKGMTGMLLASEIKKFSFTVQLHFACKKDLTEIL